MVLNSTKNGKRKQRWIATGLPEKGNKRRAEQMLREKLSEEEHKAPNGEAANIWFTEYIQYWLTISQQRVDEVTFQNYQMIARRHVLPWFEGKRLLLSEVNRKVLQEFLDEKALCGRLDGKGGLSPKSIRELKNILNQTLNEAVREELLHANPCTLLRLPPKEPSCAKFYTLDQLNALLNAIREEPLYPVIRTAVVYGLRRSELLGLKWDSIDFENEMLTIRHTVVKVYTTVAKDKTKTKSSYRSFPLLPEMRDLFLTLRDEQERNRRLLGRGYVKTDYVFCWPDGRPFTSDYVRIWSPSDSSARPPSQLCQFPDQPRLRLESGTGMDGTRRHRHHRKYLRTPGDSEETGHGRENVRLHHRIRRYVRKALEKCWEIRA